MPIKSFCGATAFGLFLLVAGVFADQLTITGTVKDSAGAAVAGVIVSIGGGGGMGGGARDTTDADGAYTLVIANNTAASVTVMARSGTGGAGGFTTATGTVAAPSDGTADEITVAITLGSSVTPAAGDTVVVSGTVKDSTGAAVPDAVITYRFGMGGGTGGAPVDTTDATGAYSFTVVNTGRQTSLRVTASIGTGPTAQTGRTTISIAAPADGTTDILSVNITIGQTMNSIRPASIGVASAPTARSIIGVYQLNGRQLDKSIFTNALVKGPKTAIVRYRDGARMKLSVEK
jgi:hypothetical protein